MDPNATAWFELSQSARLAMNMECTQLKQLYAVELRLSFDDMFGGCLNGNPREPNSQCSYLEAIPFGVQANLADVSPHGLESPRSITRLTRERSTASHWPWCISGGAEFWRENQLEASNICGARIRNVARQAVWRLRLRRLFGGCSLLKNGLTPPPPPPFPQQKEKHTQT